MEAACQACDRPPRRRRFDVAATPSCPPTPTIPSLRTGSALRGESPGARGLTDGLCRGPVYLGALRRGGVAPSCHGGPAIPATTGPRCGRIAWSPRRCRPGRPHPPGDRRAPGRRRGGLGRGAGPALPGVAAGDLEAPSGAGAGGAGRAHQGRPGEPVPAGGQSNARGGRMDRPIPSLLGGPARSLCGVPRGRRGMTAG